MPSLLEQIKLDSDQVDSPFVFLQYLDKYLNTIKNDPLLSKALLLMREYHQQESAELARKVSDAQTDLYYIQGEIQEDIENKYPLYAFRQMLRIQRDFQYIKQYKNEADIPDIELTIPNEDPYLIPSSDRKLALRKIPKRVELMGYPNFFSEFHKSFMHLLSQFEEKGTFSKYFDYDDNNGILYFAEKEIQINERKNFTNAHFLLKYLFANSPFEKHFYDELNDNDALDHKSVKSYYDACVDIQNKIKAVTGIENFLDFSSGKGLYVRINPIYSIKNT